MVLFDIAIFLLACAGLGVFGGSLVRTIIRLAQFLRMSEFVVAFLALGIATSLPELFIGIRAAIEGNPALSLGNVIGSNIADLALVGGMIFLLARRVTIPKKEPRKDAWMMAGIAIFPLILMFIGQGLSRFDGILLLFGYAMYLVWLFKRRRPEAVMLKDKIKRWTVVRDVFVLVGSAILLYFTAQFVVITGESLALQINMPSILIGLIFIAIGTSLPELVVGMRAVIIHHPQVAVGELIGSVVANSLLVLGVTAVISPITANFLLFFTSAAFMFFLVILFAVMMSRGKFTWREGIVLVLYYVLFLAIELNINQFFLT